MSAPSKNEIPCVMGMHVQTAIPMGLPLQQLPSQPLSIKRHAMEGVLEKMPTNGNKTTSNDWKHRYMTLTVNKYGSAAELAWFKSLNGLSTTGKPHGTLYINAGTTVEPVLPGHPACGLKITPKGGKPLRIRHIDVAEQQSWEQGLLEVIGSLTAGGPNVLEGMLEKMPSSGTKTDADSWKPRYMTLSVMHGGGAVELAWFKSLNDLSGAGRRSGTLYINAGTTVEPVLPGHPACGLKITPKGGKPLRIRHTDIVEQQRWEQGLLEVIGSLTSGVHSLGGMQFATKHKQPISACA